ncbi:N-acetyltransferase [Micromonospora sp. WMMD1082]|uniref:N-acetyltransferase n=1 Tax=Micromonospora sp. WMMD1082 TaxID=3016104 RepID=UPI002415A15C|nr:N-acetyltransferase [Micromonospora sp. WMMD1082]MDG4795172.1 N-acetyltransferase [Micromonospora sp. WMMD1082]
MATTMQSEETAMVRAGGADVPELAMLLAHALSAGSVGAWLVPDAGARVSVLHRYAELVLEHAVRHGQVDTTEDLSALAVWYSGSVRPAVPTAWARDLERLLGVSAGRFALFHAAQPNVPHRYLAHVVDGRGGADGGVLAGRLRVLDAAGLPSVAEIVSDRPRESLLARCGYQARSPVLLESGGPVLWRMWRSAPVVVRDGLPRRVRLQRYGTR